MSDCLEMTGSPQSLSHTVYGCNDTGHFNKAEITRKKNRRGREEDLEKHSQGRGREEDEKHWGGVCECLHACVHACVHVCVPVATVKAEGTNMI